MSDQGWLRRWADAVNEDPENAHIGRWSSFVVRARDDAGAEQTVRYHRGKVELNLSPAGQADEAVITLRGSRRAWRELADPHAPPGRHDLLALTKVPDGIQIVTGGDHLLRHLRVITRLVEVGRACG